MRFYGSDREYECLNEVGLTTRKNNYRTRAAKRKWRINYSPIDVQGYNIKYTRTAEKTVLTSLNPFAYNSQDEKNILRRIKSQWRMRIAHLIRTIQDKTNHQDQTQDLKQKATTDQSIFPRATEEKYY